MKRQDLPPPETEESLLGKVAEASGQAAALPFKLTGRLLLRTVQVLFALVVVVLHPQIKWLAHIIADSSLVQSTIKPAFQGFITNVYEPYFKFLGQLPPLGAAFSIALPLAVLEPAKFVATIMIAERPKMGVLLWLLLQGVGFILIDKTWVAVRPQARKIWIVSRIHAWIWLNVEHGKYWIKTSSLYRTLVRWKKQGRREIRTFFLQFSPRRRRRT